MHQLSSEVVKNTHISHPKTVPITTQLQEVVYMENLRNTRNVPASINYKIIKANTEQAKEKGGIFIYSEEDIYPFKMPQ